MKTSKRLPLPSAVVSGFLFEGSAVSGVPPRSIYVLLLSAHFQEELRTLMLFEGGRGIGQTGGSGGEPNDGPGECPFSADAPIHTGHSQEMKGERMAWLWARCPDSGTRTGRRCLCGGRRFLTQTCLFVIDLTSLHDVFKVHPC